MPMALPMLDLRVVHDHSARLLDDLHLGGVDVDAVAEDGLGAEDAVILQALDGAAAVVLEGVVHVVHALGDMDVIAGAAVVGLDHPVEGLVGDGEERVAAEHRREHGILALLAFGDEVGIFLDGLQALLLAVAVGDLIAQAGAQAETLALLGDGVQRAGDLAVAGVVVEDGGDALLDGVDVERGGAGAWCRPSSGGGRWPTTFRRAPHRSSSGCCRRWTGRGRVRNRCGCGR